MNRFLITTAVAAAFAATALAQTEHVLNYAGDVPLEWGSGVLEDYDVAIQIADPAFAGAKVTKVQAPAVTDGSVTDYSIWLSTELKLDKKLNAPDLLSVAVEPGADGMITLVLEQPVEIPEGGLFVGYSLHVAQVTDESAKPVTVTTSTTEGAFWVHTSRRQIRWAAQSGYAADLAVTLLGDFHSLAASIDSVDETEILHGEAPEVTFAMRNRGLDPISSIAWSCRVDGTTYTFEQTFDPALPPVYGQLHTVRGELPVFYNEGNYPVKVEVSHVNGAPNEIKAEGANAVYVFPWLPVNRPLYEEYTGTWCGWCPRGMIGLEGMNGAWPDDFIAVVYHTGEDVMATKAQPTTTVSVAPGGHLNRTEWCDPYSGSLEEMPLTWHDGIEVTWQKVRAQRTTAAVDLSASWTDDSHTAIEATAIARFVRDYSGADMRWVWFLTADGLGGVGGEWLQSNYYSGEKKYADGDLKPLTELPKYMVNAEFNEVIINASDVRGIAGSIPADIEWLEPQRSEMVFNLDECVNLHGLCLAQPQCSYHVVAAVIDARTNRVLNAARCPIGEVSVGALAADSPVVETIWLSPDGTRLPSAPARGVAIRLDRRADGTTTATKTTL